MEEKIRKFANRVLETLQAEIVKTGQVTLAVSGGKSPIALFEYLSGVSIIDWSKVTVLLVDERVTDNVTDSNSALVRKYLLQNDASEATFINVYNSNITVLDNILQLNNANHVIQVAILGMGLDGHTASIFPCCAELPYLLHTSAKFAVASPTTAPYQRITLTLSGLLAIPHLFLFAQDEVKQDLLRAMIAQDDCQYPISYLLKYSHIEQ